MADKKFEIFVEDAGDYSVGMKPVITLKAELDENMVEHLKENKILGEFEQKLEALVKDYFEAETYYRTYDTIELEAEREYYEKLEEEKRNIPCCESIKNGCDKTYYEEEEE